MTAEQFWEDDPQLFISYRTSFINRKQREMEERDYLCWLQGLYIHDGNSKIMKRLTTLLINMFSRKKDDSKIEFYPDEPYSSKRKKEQEQENKKENVKEGYNDYENSLILYSSFKQRCLDRMLKKEGKE